MVTLLASEVFIYHKAFPMPALSYKFQMDPLSSHEMDDSAQFISSVCWRGQSSSLVAANSTGHIKILEMLLINLVQNRVVSLKLSSKGSAAGYHCFGVVNGEGMRMLLWWHIPRDVMQVMVNYSFGKLRLVADHSVKVAFWGGNKDLSSMALLAYSCKRDIQILTDFIITGREREKKRRKCSRFPS
ncbi:Protein SPA1-RELATED 4, partial [Cucurbita argyrosperma subsp. argyrosperma]